MNFETSQNRKIILWLWIGFGMILIQILLGGITRLTGSGLSITRWDIITGIIYPFSEQSWQHHFDLYKQTPQFKKINQDIQLSQFKFIFFWEYIHRLWARVMGFVFIIPFVYFLIKKQISKTLFYQLLIVIMLAILVASLGWIMVASGLIERPWVNAYKLSFHLSTAVFLLLFLFYTILSYTGKIIVKSKASGFNVFFLLLIIFCSFQIFLGGIMAGMKAGLAATDWPTIQGKWIPEQIFQLRSLSTYLFSEYELSHAGPVIVQFFHRSMAYLIFLGILLYIFILLNKTRGKIPLSVWGLLWLCGIQIFLGIWTLIQSVGYIPLWPAVLHQLFGILLLVQLIYVYFTYEPEFGSKKG